jgi:peptide deformylase
MDLVYYPDPRLRDVAKPVKAVDDELKAALPRMFEIMYRARGIGLAGPQVALGRRVVVANLAADPDKKDGEQVFLNPEILERSGEKKEEEGCLSLPGVYPIIVRSERLVVRYQDLEGKEQRREVQGLEAKLFQHEIDHLDGILLVDKMSPADKKQWAPLLKELEEEYEAKQPPARGRRGRASRSKSPR